MSCREAQEVQKALAKTCWEKYGFYLDEQTGVSYRISRRTPSESKAMVSEPYLGLMNEKKIWTELKINLTYCKKINSLIFRWKYE